MGFRANIHFVFFRHRQRMRVLDFNQVGFFGLKTLEIECSCGAHWYRISK